MGKDPEPDEEKKADLFADLLEYREAFALLKGYGLGFAIQFERVWHGDDIVPLFGVRLTKLSPEKSRPILWSVAMADESFLKAVRLTARAAELEAVAYDERLRAGPGTVATGQQGPMPINVAFKINP